MDVELRLLRAFEAVAEELHFGRAARRLYVSQPSLSRAVQELERAIGVALFARTSREVRLTPAGADLKRELPSLMAEYARVLEHARRTGRGEAGELRLAFLPSATNVVLPAVVRAFRSAFPEVALALSETLDDEALEGVLARRFDVALVRTVRPQPELAFARLVREPLCVVVPADHRFAGRLRVRYEDLREDGLILWPRRDAPESYDDVVERCRRAGFSPTVVQEASDAYTILSRRSRRRRLCARRLLRIAARRRRRLRPAGGSAHHPPGGVARRRRLGRAPELRRRGAQGFTPARRRIVNVP